METTDQNGSTTGACLPEEPPPWGFQGASRAGGAGAWAAVVLLLCCCVLLALPGLRPGFTWYSADAPLALPPWKGALEPGEVHPRNPYLGDQDFLYYPFLRLVARELAERGEFPLWNPHVYGGVPLVGNAQFPLLYPVHGLLWLSQAGGDGFEPAAFDRALVWHALLRLLICVLGGWLWLRRLGAVVPAAVLGSLVLGFGGYHQVWLQFTPAQVFCFLPAALGFLEGYLRRAGRLDLVLFTLCLAASHHGGYPQTSFFLGGLVVLYSLVRGWKRPSLLLCSLAAFVAAGLLALPAWLPFLEYLGHSEIRALRAGDPLWPEGIAASRVLLAGAVGSALLIAAFVLVRKRAPCWIAVPLAGLALLALNHPRFGADGELLLGFVPGAWGSLGSGLIGAGAWTGPQETNPVEAAADVLGVGALFLCLLAPFLFRLRKDALVLVLWIVALLAWLYGSKAPGFHQAGRVALFIAQPSRALVLVPLAGAVVAAFALQRLLALSAEQRRELARPFRVLRVWVLLGLMAWLTWGAGLWPAWAEGLWPSRAAPRLTVRDLALLALSVGALSWLLRTPRPGLAAWAVVGVLALDLLSLGFGYTPATRLSEIYPRTPELAWLEERAQEAAREGRPFRVLGDRMTLRPNTAMVYGLSDARGHDCFDPTTYVRLLYGLPLLAGRVASDPAEMGHGLLPMGQRAFDLLGVRFYCTTEEWAHPPGWREAFVGTGMRVYENNEALPRAFLARDQVWIHRQPLPFADPALDPGQTVFFEDATIDLPGAPFTEGAARIVEDSPNRVLVETGADGWSWLVLMDNHYPGWRAYLDNGDELPLLRAYGTWRAVALPPGSQRVSFVYAPTSWLLGRLLAGGGLLLLGVLLWFPGKRKIEAQP